MINAESLKKDKVLQKKIQTFLQLQQSSSDSDIINYNTWLREKNAS